MKELEKYFKETLETLKEMQENGKYTRCPVCGQRESEPECINRLGVRVCNKCLDYEKGLLEMNVDGVMITSWHVFSAHGDFKETKGKDALKVVEKEYIPEIIKRYDQYYNLVDRRERTYVSLRMSVKGFGVFSYDESGYLTMMFDCADGTVCVRLKKEHNQTMYACDFMPHVSDDDDDE